LEVVNQRERVTECVNEKESTSERESDEANTTGPLRVCGAK
jgi:hypothetical protein